MRPKFTTFAILIPVVFAFYYFLPNTSSPKTEMIHGVNLVALSNPIIKADIKPVLEINSNWISIIPYAFCRPNRPDIYYNVDRQWWGEKPEGVRMQIQYAQELNLKVMVKPQMWVAGEGWPGDFEMETEEQWSHWEEDYQDYILTYADLADSMGVDMFCIGTEYRKVVQQRPDFWIDLIAKLRSRFKGKLTYAANWDNFENVSFWTELDYIGIDAYFPLSDSKTPEVRELTRKWEPIVDQIEELSEKVDKPVLFTEYGYRSVDQTANGHWDSNEELEINMEAQKNAYEAIYQALYPKSWYHGGFLWKWFPHNDKAGGLSDSRFTPQNKPAIEIIKKYHSGS